MLCLPQSIEVIALADWVEASILFCPSLEGAVSFAVVESELEEAEIDAPELCLMDLRDCIDERMRVIGNSYPLEREGAGFIVRGPWEDYSDYSFVLLLSLNHHYSELSAGGASIQKGARLFELFAGHALKCYLKGVSFRIGWPREEPVPTDFSVAVRKLVSLTHEQLGSDQLIDEDTKDDGLDVVGWVPFHDGRPGQAVMLMQCGVGKNWCDKLTDLSIDIWRNHVNWAVTPIRAFAVPICCQDSDKWLRCCKEGGIVLDRVRLISMASRECPTSDLTPRVKDWCVEQIEKLSELNLVIE